MSTTLQATIMLASGVGIPILAALNAALGQRIGAPAGAAVILFTVALLAAGAVFWITGGSLRRIAEAPPHLFAGGLFVAFYVLAVTWIAPGFGVGNAVFFVLLGQLLSAAVIDHWGLFGARISPLSATRALGIAMMGAGVFMTQIAGRN
jgi:transporter family-2 protein